MTRARKALIGGGAALALLAGYLCLWPVPVEPVAWTPPGAPGLAGAFAPNSRLAGVEWLGRGAVQGPEATAIDAGGRIYAGALDGTIVRWPPDGRGAPEVFARTRGRPLGMAFDRAGHLVVADAKQGLLAVAPDGTVRVLAAGHEGEPFRFADDVDIGDDGTIYFTDASRRFGIEDWKLDIVEHGATGRLLAFHPESGKTEVLLDGLHFANGVAVGPGSEYVLVCETATYRVLRRWLCGPRAGSVEPFIENLPGFPDNVTFARERGVFWVALPSPRQPLVDALAPHPFLRKVLVRLPRAVWPEAKRHGFILGVDLEGRVVENLQDPSPGSYSPITSVRERAGALYLGSLSADGLGRIAAPAPP